MKPSTPSSDTEKRSRPRGIYEEAEWRFRYIAEMDNLDDVMSRQPSIAEYFEWALDQALMAAFTQGSDDAHLFIQRTLFRIYRLNFFWFDEPRRYNNEHSIYLRSVRERIEKRWQEWEMSAHSTENLRAIDAREGLELRVKADIEGQPREDYQYIEQTVTSAGYIRLLQIGTLESAAEAGQLSRLLGGAVNEIQSTLNRVLISKFRGGMLTRNHSFFFTSMLSHLGLSTQPDGCVELAPWQVLARLNHNFLLSESKRFYLRQIGGLLYLENALPGALIHFQNAAERLGHTPVSADTSALHMREDERHGRWMLDDVALPLAERFPAYAWEMLLGYDEQRRMSLRALAATMKTAQAAERVGR